jgi:hypothetical protein
MNTDSIIFLVSLPYAGLIVSYAWSTARPDVKQSDLTKGAANWDVK